MQFAPPARPRRRPSLTPMIDVVFLLLVFFMLASRFGVDSVLPLPLASAGGTYEGPPRLITITPESVLLNGQVVNEIGVAVAPLMSDPKDMLILRPQDGATLQRIVSVSETLRDAGFSTFVLVE